MNQLIERLNKLPATLKVGVLLGVVILVIAATYFVFISDVTDKIARLQSQQASADRTLAEKQSIADNLKQRRAEMEFLEKQLQEALTELPEKKDIEELLAQLHSAGEESGLEINEVVPGAEVLAGFYAKIPIKIGISGNYHKIAMFLQKTASLRRIVNVTNIKLHTPDIEGSTVILKSEFLATTFRFNESKQSPKEGVR